jgi:hypothetical protein
MAVLAVCMIAMSACAMASPKPAGQDQPLAQAGMAENNRPYRNVQGPEYLTKFAIPTAPVRVKSGKTVALWDIMPVFEDPDFDPVQYLDQIEVEWQQVSGPKVSFNLIQVLYGIEIGILENRHYIPQG